MANSRHPQAAAAVVASSMYTKGKTLSAPSPVADQIDLLVAGLFRYGSTWLLVGMLVFVLLPFAAPLLMVSGWAGLGEFIYRLYGFFCHQLPQRSWFLFGPKLTYTLAEIAQVYPTTDTWSLRAFDGTPQMGWKVAWSDRMVSFYSMTPVFGLFYVLLRRLRPQRPVAWRILVLALLPLAVDGGTHLLNDLIYGASGGGFRDTNGWLVWLTGNAFAGFYAGDHAGTFNWWMRLLSGLVAAWGVAFWLFPWLDRLFQDEWKRLQQLHQPAPVAQTALQGNQAGHTCAGL